MKNPSVSRDMVFSLIIKQILTKVLIPFLLYFCKEILYK